MMPPTTELLHRRIVQLSGEVACSLEELTTLLEAHAQTRTSVHTQCPLCMLRDDLAAVRTRVARAASLEEQFG